MPIRSAKDVVDAVDSGRFHSKRFLKNAGTTGDGQWQDWSYSSGQPAYDARIGSAITFTPMVAQRNDAIFFPDIPSGMDRHLLSIDFATIPGGASQTNVEYAIYDLLAVYPLIDGDSTDTQSMVNDLSLTRYSDGLGVMPVIVNHVSPMLAACNATVEYINSDGDLKSVVWGVNNIGQNKVCFAPVINGSSGGLYASLASGDRGVRSIVSITFDTPPGGLFAVYLCKPIGGFSSRSFVSSFGVAGQKQFATSNGLNLPKIKDGAWLGMFYMPSGGGRSVVIHGNAQFVWG